MHCCMYNASLILMSINQFTRFSCRRFNYQQHCAKCNAPVFKLLRGQFWGFSPHRGDTLQR